MADKIYNVLFVCDANSARSIIAEGILNALGKGRFRAYSAGAAPEGEVATHALKVLKDWGFDDGDFYSKDWAEFAKAEAPELHFVFTLCDSLHGEECPTWNGTPVTAHWGVEDPRSFDGSDEEIEHKFFEVALILKRHIELLTQLPLESLDEISLQDHVEDIPGLAQG